MIAEPSPLRITGLSALAGRYPAVLCDIWGVIHNGVGSFASAVDALGRYRADGGVVVLISNAPRPSWSVRDQLDGLKVDRAAYDSIVTSGDVAIEVLRPMGPARVYHLGPDRDRTLYQGLAVELCDADSAMVICCTGLVDDDTETAEDYRPLLQGFARRGVPMICANPDLVVERGKRLIPCAGLLAALYQELGGEATSIGKPLPAVYAAALARIGTHLHRPVERQEVLAIGDGVNTDIRGANDNRIDVLFITEGIHAAELRPADVDAVGAFLRRHRVTALATMPHLSW